MTLNVSFGFVLPTPVSAPPIVFPIPATVPLIMLLGLEHIKADKLGGLILSIPSNFFSESESVDAISTKFERVSRVVE